MKRIAMYFVLLVRKAWERHLGECMKITWFLAKLLCILRNIFCIPPRAYRINKKKKFVYIQEAKKIRSYFHALTPLSLQVMHSPYALPKILSLSEDCMLFILVIHSPPCIPHDFCQEMKWTTHDVIYGWSLSW